jgi:hypothetical protein
MSPVIIHPDSFSAVLLESPALEVTLEQQEHIKKVLAKACSDSRFADKAFIAIWQILTGGNTIPPVVTSLNPSSVVIGSPSFDVHVIGTGFKPDSVIMFAGREEPTTFVSATELTTGVDMSVWAGPDAVPVAVLNADGILSDPMNFTFTDPTARKVEPVKPVVVPVKK